MFFSLLKVQLKMLYSGIFKSKNSKRSTALKPILFGLLYLFIFAYLGVAFGSIFFILGLTLESTGVLDLYFPVIILLSTLFGMMGTMMSAEKLLFEGKDNDLLLSMPIPPSYILATRLVSLATLECAFSLVVLVPGVVSFYILNGVTLFSLLSGIVGIIALLIPPLVISILLGRILSEIHSRAKNKKFIDTLSYFLFFGAYLVFAYNVSPIIEYISVNGAMIIGCLKNFAPLLWWGNAMINGDALSLVGMLLLSSSILVLTVYLLSRGYSALISRSKNSYKKVYKERSLKTKTPIKAILMMELGRFFGTPIYLFNCGLGIMLSVLAAIMLLTNSELFLSDELFGEIPFIVPVIVTCVMMFISSTICPACVSISIEGKFFPMIKTFPISTKSFLSTKILMNMIVASPNYILLPLIVGIGLNLGFINIASIMFFGFIYQLFLATAGLLLNLKMPKMDWTNIAMVVKQSGSVTVATLSSMVLTILNGIGMSVLSLAIGAFAPELSCFAIIALAMFYTLVVLISVFLLYKFGEKMMGKI